MSAELLERFGLVADENGNAMWPIPAGEWVRYADHATTLSRLTAELEAVKRERDANDAALLLNNAMGVDTYTAMLRASKVAIAKSEEHRAARETAERERDEAREALDSCAALLEVMAESALARDDTAEWALMDVMARRAREAGGRDG